jgi:glycosyltransferase involved in cell wall biosynthesis
MPTARLSLVTPALNQRAHLERCIKHVRALGDDVEHIVSDGGSTDGTVELCEAEARRRPDRFRFRSAPDGGMYEALNKGFELADGEIYGYVNCDDVLLPWAADVVREAFARSSAAWVVGDGLERTDGRWTLMVHPPARAVAAYLRLGGHLAQPAVFFRRSLFERAGGFDARYRLLGDHALWLRFAALGAPVARAWEVLAVLQVVPGQLMQSRAAEATRERARALDEAYGHHHVGHRRPVKLTWAALHRLGIASLLGERLLSRPLPGPWAQMRHTGWWELTSTRDALRALVRSNVGHTYLRLTPDGRPRLDWEHP